MTKPVTDLELIKNKAMRVAYCEHDFWWWFQYHFGWANPADFHSNRSRSMAAMLNIFMEGFRGSRKTSLVRWFIVWCIVYKIHEYVVRQSYDQWASADNVRQIAKMLFKRSIITDHGILFPIAVKKDDFAKKWQSDFTTKNGVRVRAISLGSNSRWANEYDMEQEITSRPTLLVWDDIDVNDSVQNPQVIEKNYKKITGETIEALDQFKRQIIILGNTILEDGVIPRFYSLYRDNKQWRCYRQPLIDENGHNARPTQFTDAVVDMLKWNSTKVSWKQNYLLEPDVMGNGIFIRKYFDYYLFSEFENPESFLKKKDLVVWIHIDPAFSTSDTSDDSVVMALGMHTISKKFYEIDGYAGTSAPSKTISETIDMVRRVQWEWFDVQYISIEFASINKRQTQFIKDLKDALVKREINIPVKEYIPKWKKEDRIKVTLEPLLSQQGFIIRRDLADKAFNTKLESQFLQFPNWDHDDIVDDIEHGVTQLRARKKMDQPKEKKSRQVYNPVTGKYITVIN